MASGEVELGPSGYERVAPDDLDFIGLEVVVGLLDLARSEACVRRERGIRGRHVVGVIPPTLPFQLLGRSLDRRTSPHSRP